MKTVKKRKDDKLGTKQAYIEDDYAFLIDGFNLCEKKGGWSGEQRLCARMLINAILESRRKKLEGRQAREWLKSDSEAPFSLIWVLDIIGLPDYLSKVRKAADLVQCGLIKMGRFRI